MEEKSVWKMEIHLRKRPGTPPATPPPASGEKTSIWKKELRLRKPETAEPAPVQPAPAEPAPAGTGQMSGHDLHQPVGAFGPAPVWVGQPQPVPLAPADVPAEPAVQPPEGQLELPHEPVEPQTASPAARALWYLEGKPQSEPEPVVPTPSNEVEPPVEHLVNAFDSAPAHEPPVPAPEPDSGLAWWEAGPAGPVQPTEPTDESAPANGAWEQEAATEPEPEYPPEPVWSAPPAHEVEPPVEHEPTFLAPQHDDTDVPQPVEPDPVPPEPVWAPHTFHEAEPPVEPEHAFVDPTPEPDTNVPHPVEPEPEPVFPPEPVWAAAVAHEVEVPSRQPEEAESPQPVPAAAPVEHVAAEDTFTPVPEEADAPSPVVEVAELVVAAEAAEAVAETPRKRGFSRRTKQETAPADSSRPAKGHAIKHVVGLRIGSSQLAAARIENNGTAELVQVARSPLPRGIVTGGEVRDSEALTKALKDFFAEHKLPRKGIRLGVASNRIGVRVLEAPKVDDPKLFENSIRFHAQETLPIAISDAIVDYVVLGETAGEGGEPMAKVLFVFAHRELVERHVDACRRAGLKLDGIDLEAFALLRALAAPLDQANDASRAVVAVAIGQERTIFAVSDGRVCDFTRVLEWGGGSLDVAVARELDITPSQAEPIKHALSLDGAPTGQSEYPPETIETAQRAVREELQVLSRELVASLQYYQTRPESLDIGEITVSGGGAQLVGFAAELERLIGVPVQVGDPFSRVVVNRKLALPAEAGSLAIAIGLGIED